MKKHSTYILVFLTAFITPIISSARDAAEFVQTPYEEQKVVFDFYFDEPTKIATALYWLRSLINPMTEAPYNIAPDFHDIKIVIHGTEIVTLAKKNYKKYKNIVERMRYYTEFGVEFKVCAMAAKDFEYEISDFHEFVDVVPSAITELAHWQLKGYALIVPKVPLKKFSIEDIR